jgi:tetratricopeptide (TPR) repeat protein
MRGGALMGKRDFPGARRSFEQALELDPGYFPAAANLARLDLADKKPEDARKRFEAVLARNPKSARAYLALAQLRAGARGSAEEVGALVAKAVAADPKRARGWHDRAFSGTDKQGSTPRRRRCRAPNRPQPMDARLAHRAGDGNRHHHHQNWRRCRRADAARIAELQIAAKDKDGRAEPGKRRRASPITSKRRLVVALHGRRAAAATIAVAREVQAAPKQAAGFILEGDVHASQKSWNEALAAYRAGSAGRIGRSVSRPTRRCAKVADADNFARTWLKDHPDVAPSTISPRRIARKDYAAAISTSRCW